MQNSTEVLLNWEDITGDETGFVIQRTDADSTFMTIDTVGANVTSFTDTPPGPDRTIVYRVIAMNSELTSVPSKPANIELFTGLQTLSIKEGVAAFPNPFKDKFTLTFVSSREQMINIRLFSIGGLLVKDLKNVSVISGTNEISLSAEKLSPGIYFLECKPEEGKAVYIKVIGN